MAGEQNTHTQIYVSLSLHLHVCGYTYHDAIEIVFFWDFRFQTTPNPQIGYIKLNYPNVSHDIPIIIVYTQSVLLTWTWICPLDLLQNKHHT